MPERKKKLSIKEQVEHLKEKGVTFNLISESEAEKYLSKNNNFFKLSSYRKNYDKNESGKYVGLDFAMLKDLAIIDMEMRYVLLQMALDVEHFLKIYLLNKIENSDEDGYSIVSEYREQLPPPHDRTLDEELRRNSGSPYNGDLVNKYLDDMPIWVFIEIISFGSLIHFAKFYGEKTNDKVLIDYYYILLRIKDIRNAAAHSTCLINNLGARNAKGTPNYSVMRSLSGINRVGEKMSNASIQGIVTLLYMHKAIVTSDGVHKHQAENIHNIIDRMYRNKDYYLNNISIMSMFEFLKKVVDKFF
ncbi:MAG: Abi family protein [Clostridia bacterium]